MKKCKKCKGKGRIVHGYYFRWVGDITPRPQYKTCPQCRGTGRQNEQSNPKIS